MEDAKIKEKIDRLTKDLKRYNYEYYVLAEPTIPDRELMISAGMLMESHSFVLNRDVYCI